MQALTLPALPPRDDPDLRVLGQLLSRAGVRAALRAVLLLISGHFAGFTEIRPLMEDVTHLSAAAISAVLLGYGATASQGSSATSPAALSSSAASAARSCSAARSAARRLGWPRSRSERC